MRIFPTSLLILLVFALTSCSDDKTVQQSCSTQLDNSEFQAVIDNKDCSNYERGSAYLGKAGFSFSNFSKNGASDNFATTLGITSTWNDNQTGIQKDYTNALCLVGNNDFVDSQCVNNAEKRDTSKARLPEDIEISFFGLVGDLILKTYGNLDLNFDGDISETEQTAFTGVQSSNSSSGASMGIQEGVFQFISGGTSYFYDATPKSCYNSSDYTGVLNTSTPLSSAACSTLFAASSALYPIIQVNSITPIFDASVDAKNYPPTTFLSDYSLRATALDEDFKELGINSDSDFRKSLKESVEKMDNGATSKGSGVCKSVIVFDLVKTIAVIAADSTTASVVKEKNLLTLKKLGEVDPQIKTALNALDSPVPGLSITLGRMIYKKGNTYTDDYTQADTSLKTALQQLRDLSLNDDGTLKETQASDGIIDFRELICLSEQ